MNKHFSKQHFAIEVLGRAIKVLRLAPIVVIYKVLRVLTKESLMPIPVSETLSLRLNKADQVKPNIKSDFLPVEVHMLWIGGKLSRLENLSVRSFLRNGFKVSFWTYGFVENVPPGAEVRNADEIVSRNRIFKSKSGSLAPFSDLFRYEVLVRHGGMWADADVLCLISHSQFRQISKDAFVVTTKLPYGNNAKLNANIIYSPPGEPNPFLDLAVAVTRAFPKDRLEHFEIGPDLLHNLYVSYERLRPKIFSPNFANPIHYWESPRKLLDARQKIPEGAAFIHCFNEVILAKGFKKEDDFPEGSILHQLDELYS